MKEEFKESFYQDQFYYSMMKLQIYFSGYKHEKLIRYPYLVNLDNIKELRAAN